VCIWTCVFERVYLNVCIWTCVFERVYLNVCIWTCVFQCVYFNVCISMCVFECVYLNVCIWMCVFECVYLNVCMCKTNGKWNKFKLHILVSYLGQISAKCPLFSDSLPALVSNNRNVSFQRAWPTAWPHLSRRPTTRTSLAADIHFETIYKKNQSYS